MTMDPPSKEAGADRLKRRGERLRSVADTIRELRAAPEECDDDPRWRDSRFFEKGRALQRVDSFHMDVWLAERTDTEPGDVGDGGCNTIGCIAGTTISLFRRETQRIISETDQRLIWTVAAEILGLAADTAAVLFRGTDDGRMNLAAVTPGEAAAACDKAADGHDGGDIWSHVPMGQPRPTPPCATWR